MYTVGNVYVIAGVAVIGGALFGETAVVLAYQELES